MRFLRSGTPKSGGSLAGRSLEQPSRAQWIEPWPEATRSNSCACAGYITSCSSYTLLLAVVVSHLLQDGRCGNRKANKVSVATVLTHDRDRRQCPRHSRCKACMHLLMKIKNAVVHCPIGNTAKWASRIGGCPLQRGYYAILRTHVCWHAQDCNSRNRIFLRFITKLASYRPAKRAGCAMR